MKKLLLIALALMLVFVNVAYAETVDIAAMTDDELKALSEQIESELTRRENERSTTIVEEDDGEIIYVNDGESSPDIIFASEEQLRSRLRKIELTTENWNQYLGDYYYPYETVMTNNFGEVTSRYDQRAVGFGFKEGYIGCMRDVAVKFSGVKRYGMGVEWIAEENYNKFAEDIWQESDEEFTADVYTPCRENVHLEDYECLATTGYIYVLEVSPEMTQWLWQHPSRSIDIMVGDRHYRTSDFLWALYEDLNP